MDPCICLMPHPARSSRGDRPLRFRRICKPSILVSVRIQLLYFGLLKDLFGAERDTLDLPAGARVEDALRILRDGMLNPRATVHGGIWDTLAVAVNREYAGASPPLK